MSTEIYGYSDGDSGTCTPNDECYLVVGTAAASDKCKDICNPNMINQGCVAPKKLEGIYRFPDYIKSRGKGCDGKNIPSCYAQAFWLPASCLSTYTQPLRMDIPNNTTPIQFKWDPSDAHICTTQRWNNISGGSGGYVDLASYGNMNTTDYLALDQGGYENKKNWGDYNTHGCRAYGPAGNLPHPHCDGNNEWHASYHEGCNWFSHAL